ncbi:MAG TPA: hypothetical protein P5164_04810 [Thermoanaerobaculia bacterium]|nr:hypothetical protein [Thermoanaerobaculia bacterium]
MSYRNSLVERAARDPLHEDGERLVVCVAVGPALPRRETARRRRPESEECRLRRLRPVAERPVAVQPEEVGEPRRVGQEVRHAELGVVCEPLREVIANGGVEADQPLVGEREDGRGGELLRDRPDGEDGAGCRGPLAVADGAVALLEDDLAVS